MGDRIKRNVKVLFFLISALPILISGCSFPKIIILKDPLTPEEHLNLGVAYERRGELDSAIKEYQRAAEELPLALLHLGNAHFLKNQWKEAEVYYREAIEKNPKNADAYNIASKSENGPKADGGRLFFWSQAHQRPCLSTPKHSILPSIDL